METPRIGLDRPLVWVLLGAHVGDNRQAVALARALGWPFVEKPLVFNPLFRAPNLLLGASLATLSAGTKSELSPPWPDLVIGVGRRSVPIAMAIKAKAGARTRLVQIGRPRAPLDWFDLVVTTPQYGLADRSNVLRNLLPLVQSEEPGEIELAYWRERLKHLPRPWIAVLAGGTRWPFWFGPRTASRLGRRAVEQARACDGALLVATSPRTGARAADALAAAIEGPAIVHRWLKTNGNNPYRSLLALADRFIVTGESVSMIAEAVATGKPVQVFELPRLIPSLPRWLDGRSNPVLARCAEAGIFSPPREVRRVTDALEAGGYIDRRWASRSGTRPSPATPEPPPDSLTTTVARVHDLFRDETATSR